MHAASRVAQLAPFSSRAREDLALVFIFPSIVHSLLRPVFTPFRFRRLHFRELSRAQDVHASRARCDILHTLNTNYKLVIKLCSSGKTANGAGEEVHRARRKEESVAQRERVERKEAGEPERKRY